VSLFHVDIMHNMGYGQMDVGEEVKEAARWAYGYEPAGGVGCRWERGGWWLVGFYITLLLRGVSVVHSTVIQKSDFSVDTGQRDTIIQN
jgi:hypothetical protein